MSAAADTDRVSNRGELRRKHQILAQTRASGSEKK